MSKEYKHSEQNAPEHSGQKRFKICYMGYINSKFSETGTEIQLQVRGKKYGGKVSELPFFKKSYVK